MAVGDELGSVTMGADCTSFGAGGLLFAGSKRAGVLGPGGRTAGCTGAWPRCLANLGK